jgi:hypothetical protein
MHAQYLALLMQCELTGRENFEKQTEQSEIRTEANSLARGTLASVRRFQCAPDGA